MAEPMAEYKANVSIGYHGRGTLSMFFFDANNQIKYVDLPQQYIEFVSKYYNGERKNIKPNDLNGTQADLTYTYGENEQINITSILLTCGLAIFDENRAHTKLPEWSP